MVREDVGKLGLISPSGKRTYAGGSRCEEEFSDDDTAAKSSKSGRSRGPYDWSIYEKLRKREANQLEASKFFLYSVKEKFLQSKLQVEIDTFDPESPEIKMPFQRTRSKVTEIVASSNLIFTLTKTGVCIAFDRDKLKRICFLNATDDEVIRSLFLNKVNNSIITVSVFREDNFSSLRCRSTHLQYVRKKETNAGFALFESESLRWPGFVEFDDLNSKVLTFSSEKNEYKIWGLANYEHLYTITDSRIQEIKVSPNILLLIFSRSHGGGYVPLRILDVETGKVLRDFKHLLHRHKKIDFMEQFNEKLLIKQERENLQIVDVNTSRVVEVERSHFLTPNAFIFLYDTQLFMTFRNRSVTAWNFHGELVTKFDDHELWPIDDQSEAHTSNNNIHLSQQDLIISYCKNYDCKHANVDDAHGSINISSISTGKCMAKISCDSESLQHRHALKGVSALYYNEDRNEIYTGNRSGTVCIWSS
ncbi:hypothetical protein NDN08_004708 [Rhodosorus marinus]|uniref:Transducin/WD40 repeat-like superfamily protein n=1 Tax=Rhodosorus marinus TaxID=101924 RepID=A0AAV8UM13_9RHOD|nr:hypothetical protein NDN08_004708 [Rhodosorus marinus]